MQQSRTVCAHLVECIMKNTFCQINLNLDQLLRRCRLNIFQFLAAVATLFNGAEQFVQSW